MPAGPSPCEHSDGRANRHTFPSGKGTASTSFERRISVTQSGRRGAIMFHSCSVLHFNCQLMLRFLTELLSGRSLLFHTHALATMVCKHTSPTQSLTVSLSYSASVEGDTRAEVPPTPLLTAGSRLCLVAVGGEDKAFFLGNCVK